MSVNRKKWHSEYLLGVFAFMFISLTAYNSYASVCFLPTGNCGDTSDDLAFWCEPDDEKCNKENSTSTPDVYKPETEKVETPPCTTTCETLTDHRICTTDPKGCPIVDKECLNDKYLTLQACKDGNNGADCKEVNGCFEVQPAPVLTCTSKGEDWYDECPNGKTCEEVNGCQHVTGDADSSGCPADKICVNYEYTCNDGECTEHFFKKYQDKYQEYVKKNGWIRDYFGMSIYSYLENDDGYYADWHCSVNLADGSVLNCDEGYVDEYIYFNNLIKSIEIPYSPDLYLDLDYSYLFNNVIRIASINEANFSQDDYSFYSGIYTEGESGEMYAWDEFSKDYLLYKGNTMNVKMNLSLGGYIPEDPEIELDPEPSYSGTCKEGSYNVVVSAYCSHMADSDCESLVGSDANTYVKDTVSVCYNANKKGCIDTYLIDGDEKIKPEIYQIYVDDNETQYVYNNDGDLILAEDMGNPDYTYINYDEIAGTVVPTDTFKYFFGCVSTPENYTVKIDPIKKEFSGYYGVYASYREFAFMENGDLTYGKEIPVYSGMKNKDGVYVVSKDLDYNKLILYPVMDVEERVFYNKKDPTYFIDRIYLMTIVNDFLGLDKSKIYNFGYSRKVGYKIDMGAGSCGGNCNLIDPKDMCFNISFCGIYGSSSFYGDNTLYPGGPISAFTADKLIYESMGASDDYYLSDGMYDKNYKFVPSDESNIIKGTGLSDEFQYYKAKGRDIFGKNYPLASKVFIDSEYAGKRCVSSSSFASVEGCVYDDHCGFYKGSGTTERAAKCSASNALPISSDDGKIFKTGDIIYRRLGYK